MMTNPFIDFQAQIEAVKQRHIAGEISQNERDNLIRRMKLKDDTWGDVWMLSPTGDWFRRAKGSQGWVRDYPLDLVDLPDRPITAMDIHQVAKTIHHCIRCPLHETRTRAVPGEGPVEADLMLIGEGPGYHEDKQARPFVGNAGQFLEELLDSIGYKRRDVFITNVVKCRPPNNRDPQAEELAACSDYLTRQIELVNPKVIVTLGRYSMYRFFQGESISKIHGQPKRLGDRLVVPMFHPAAALHQPRFRPLITEDFLRLPQFIAEAAALAEEPADPIDPTNAEQLSLF